MRREELLRAGDLHHLPAASDVLGPLDAQSVEALELAFLDDELRGRDALLTRVLVKVRRNLVVAVLRAEGCAAAGHERLGQQLDVRDRLRAVAHGGTGVATADDNVILALRVDVVTVPELEVEEPLRVELEVLHRKVDAVDIAAWGLESYRW